MELDVQKSRVWASREGLRPCQDIAELPKKLPRMHQDLKCWVGNKHGVRKVNIKVFGVVPDLHFLDYYSLCAKSSDQPLFPETSGTPLELLSGLSHLSNLAVMSNPFCVRFNALWSLSLRAVLSMKANRLVVIEILWFDKLSSAWL